MEPQRSRSRSSVGCARARAGLSRPRSALSAYAFGWLPIAIAVTLLLDAPTYGEFLAFFIFNAIIDVHRHYTFSFVYLDSQVRNSFPVRLVLLPRCARCSGRRRPGWRTARARSARRTPVPSFSGCG